MLSEPVEVYSPRTGEKIGRLHYNNAVLCFTPTKSLDLTMNTLTAILDRMERVLAYDRAKFMVGYQQAER